ncbi:MAG: chemotaxis protein CheB, partial [Burkholderiaceae bacterium]|nr:chemotaxis protein CheB [Burkholderiaceae bacterium]
MNGGRHGRNAGKHAFSNPTVCRTMQKERTRSEIQDVPPHGKSNPSSASAASIPAPIVGIGASAGGLEALKKFLKHVPPASGMAFVIVQHFDPAYKDLFPDLLQRYTPMRVLQITDGMEALPDRVYVIPPKKELALKEGTLRLREPTTAHGPPRPIDFFLRSLAHERHQDA